MFENHCGYQDYGCSPDEAETVWGWVYPENEESRKGKRYQLNYWSKNELFVGSEGEEGDIV